MQEIILENLVKWVQTLDFSLSRKGENYVFVCEKLNININAISREEFYVAFTTQLLLKIEKLFNLKVLGIDLKELFGIKKPEPKKEESKEEVKKPKEPISNFEKWIKEELEKAHKNGEFGKVRDPVTNMQDLLEYWKTLQYDLYDSKYFPRFPWNEVICLVSK